MKRYDMASYDEFSEYETKDGEWVRWSDAQAEIDRLRALVRDAYNEGVREAMEHEPGDNFLAMLWRESAVNYSLLNP